MATYHNFVIKIETSWAVMVVMIILESRNDNA